MRTLCTLFLITGCLSPSVSPPEPVGSTISPIHGDQAMSASDQNLEASITATLNGTVQRSRSLPRNKKTGAGGGYRVTVEVSDWRASDGRQRPAHPVEVYVRPPLVDPFVDEPSVGTIVRFEVRVGGDQSPTYIATQILPVEDAAP